MGVYKIMSRFLYLLKRGRVEVMTSDSVYIGRKIMGLRKERNLTQAELASELGLSEQALSRYENGSAQIPYAELVRLVEYFNMSVEYFSEMESQEVPEDKLRLEAYYRALNSRMQ